jgi:hypothetical protein
MLQDHNDVPGSMAVVVEAIMLPQALCQCQLAMFMKYEKLMNSRCDNPASWEHSRWCRETQSAFWHPTLQYTLMEQPPHWRCFVFVVTDAKTAVLVECYNYRQLLPGITNEGNDTPLCYRISYELEPGDSRGTAAHIRPSPPRTLAHPMA